MSKIKEITDKFYNRTDSNATVTDFINSLNSAASKTTDIAVKTNSEKEYVVNGQDVYRFLSDRGTGRIYEGLKSLELMSRTIRGASKSSTNLFDGAIIAYTPDEMKAAVIEVAVSVVNANIGVQDIYLFAKSVGSKEMTAYNAFAQKIARQVKAGSFKTETHIAEALIRVKALVNSVLNLKGTK